MPQQGEIMHRVLLLLISALLTACASVQRVPTDYSGADAGKVVLGIGAAAGTSYSSYSLLFRPTDRTALSNDQREIGRFVFFQTNMLYAQKPDYSSEVERGVVLVNSLPPGKYEVFNFNIFFNSGTVQNNYSSRDPFSMP